MKTLIAWVEFPSTDFQRAVQFYSSVLNIQLETIDCGEEKMACFPSGEGAISYAPDFKPSKDGVLVSLNSGKDIDATLKRIVINGGSILSHKTKIEAENRGYFDIFLDSEGNKVGLYGD